MIEARVKDSRTVWDKIVAEEPLVGEHWNTPTLTNSNDGYSSNEADWKLDEEAISRKDQVHLFTYCIADCKQEACFAARSTSVNSHKAHRVGSCPAQKARECTVLELQ